MRAIAGSVLLVLALVSAPPLATPASAQSTTVTAADIQRLQDTVYELDREISQIRRTDPQRVSQLQGELDDLRDEVVYLRVKLRRERTVARTDYTEVRDRLDDLRGRVRDETASTSPDSSGQAGSGSSAHVAVRDRTSRGPRGRTPSAPGRRADPASSQSVRNSTFACRTRSAPIGTRLRTDSSPSASWTSKWIGASSFPPDLSCGA